MEIIVVITLIGLGVIARAVKNKKQSDWIKQREDEIKYQSGQSGYERD